VADYVSVAELDRANAEHHGSVSVPFVLLAALLIGGGLFMIATWVLTFTWVYFSGVALVAVGFLLLLHPLAGADH
jgi:uncharacterized membrane protein